MRSILVLLFIGLPFPACFGQDAKPDAQQESSTIGPKLRFDELAGRYNILRKAYLAHEPKEGEDWLKLYLENHPNNTMVSDFFTLEQQSRGTDVGFSCLYHLVSAAAGVVDSPDLPVTRGKVAALKVLGEYYHDYPDVDTTFRNLFSGTRIPESKLFLRNLITSSRHGYVRANAMHELAKYLALEANLPGMYESLLAVLDREDAENEARINGLESMIASLKDVTIDRNRAEANSLIDQIVKGCQGELVPPLVAVRGPGLVSVKRGELDDVLKSKRERIVDRLPAIQFELNHSIGQKAPPIDGKDARGKPMSLAGFHGKIVVVMFSYKGCQPCEAMYPDNRQLIDELSEEPFVFIGVQRDETIDTVLESLESKAITWRVWWDGEDKRISTQWNIRGWPSTFVLDQRGVIRFRDIRGKELSNAVRSLLKKEAE
ncbi:MAG: redoxin domain-containing protein [Pirellula sp.]|jgi:peroxiredoxin|nr:redoxin domain-containing protein [Pirellula sp.]